jgi:hypothetical protein
MNELTFRSFVWAVLLGAGFTLGSGLVRIVFALLARAAEAGGLEF